MTKKRTLATMLALALSGALLAACDNTGTPAGAGGTAADPDRTKRTTPGAPAGGGAGGGTAGGSTSGSTNR